MNALTMSRRTNKYTSDQLRKLGVVVRPVAFHDGKMAFASGVLILWFKYNAFTERWIATKPRLGMEVNAGYISTTGKIKPIKKDVNS